LEDDGPCQLFSIIHGVDGSTNQPRNFSKHLLEIFRDLNKIMKEWNSAYSRPKVFKFDKKKLSLLIECTSKTYLVPPINTTIQNIWEGIAVCVLFLVLILLAKTRKIRLCAY